MDQRQRSLGRGAPSIAQTIARANRVVTGEDEDVLLVPTAHLGVVPYLGADDVDGLEAVGFEIPRPIVRPLLVDVVMTALKRNRRRKKHHRSEGRKFGDEALGARRLYSNIDNGNTVDGEPCPKP